MGFTYNYFLGKNFPDLPPETNIETLLIWKKFIIILFYY